MSKPYCSKTHSSFSVFHSLLNAAIFFLGILVLNQSCRKMDRVISTARPLSETETKFFNNNRSADAKEKAIVEYLQRQNNRLQFVQTTVDRIGYPRWNKAMSVSANSTTQIATENSDNNASVIYIPFAREGEEYVNAAMIINTSATDTSFSYLCDWQYASYGFDTQPDSTDAKDIFHLFTRMDNAVFGSTVFKIKDHRLLTASEIQRIIQWGKDPDSVRVYYQLKTAGSGITTELLTPVTTCTLYDVTVTFNCPPDGGGGSHGDCGPCYAFRKDVGTEAGPCWFTYEYEECTTIYIETGGGGTGSGGGNPGTGGGDPPPGDGTPPTCHGGPAMAKPMEPCDTGWEPIPVGDDPPAAPDPCNTVKKITNDTANAAFIQQVKELATPQNLGLNYEKSVLLISGSPPIVETGSGAANSGSVALPYRAGQKYKSFAHNHSDIAGGTYSVFSFADVQRIAGLLNAEQLETGSFTAFLATSKGTYYALTIQNLAKFREFFYAELNQLRITSGPEDNQQQWVAAAEKMRGLEKKYYEDDKNPLIKQTDADNANVLSKFLDFLKEADMGVALMETDANFSNFTKVEKKNNGTITRTPCN